MLAAATAADCATARGSAPGGALAAAFTVSAATRTNWLGALELTILGLERFGLESERAASGVGEAAADLRAQRAAEVAADGAAGDRQCLLGDALQHAADGLADWRVDDLAGDAADLADQVAEELLELGFVRHLEQLAGELHLQGFAEDAFALHLAILHLAELELGMSAGGARAVLKLGAVDVVHVCLLA